MRDVISNITQEARFIRFTNRKGERTQASEGKKNLARRRLVHSWESKIEVVFQKRRRRMSSE